MMNLIISKQSGAWDTDYVNSCTFGDGSHLYIFGAKQSVKRPACFACTIKCTNENRPQMHT